MAAFGMMKVECSRMLVAECDIRHFYVGNLRRIFLSLVGETEYPFHRIEVGKAFHFTFYF